MLRASGPHTYSTLGLFTVATKNKRFAFRFILNNVKLYLYICNRTILLDNMLKIYIYFRILRRTKTISPKSRVARPHCKMYTSRDFGTLNFFLQKQLCTYLFIEYALIYVCSSILLFSILICFVHMQHIGIDTRSKWFFAQKLGHTIRPYIFIFQ